jgi:glutaredoxin
MKNVVIYTTPTCGYCNMAKEFFAEKGVKYTQHDVSTDEDKRKEMVDKSGQLGVPVIVISDTQSPESEEIVIIGFDKPKLIEVLGL